MARTREVTRASDVMTPEPVCVDPAMTLPDLARILGEHEISGAPVVDRQGRVIGVVSRTDVLRRCSEGLDERAPAYMFESIGEQGDEGMEDGPPEPAPVVCVDEFMTTDPETVAPEAPLREVARLMVGARIHRIVVVDAENFPVGIITALDLLRHFSGEEGPLR